MERRVPKPKQERPSSVGTDQVIGKGPNPEDVPLVVMKIGYGDPHSVFTGAVGIILSYRKHTNGKDQRRYYVGSLQIGFVRAEGKGWRAYLASVDPREGLYGRLFPSERALHDYIVQALEAPQ